MAIDESTTIKTPTAKRTKAILALGKEAKYKRILTGSPVTKSPLDLYTQCGFLNEELLEFTSYYSFRNRYAVMKTSKFWWS
jgi:SNF2 family DNA or RNA helicase